MTEKEIQTRILHAYATRADIRLWRASTGRAVPLAAVHAALGYLRAGRLREGIASLEHCQQLHFGVTGQADLSGILADGRRLEIEVKSATGTQSPEQILYGRMIQRFNGLYILARSTADVADALDAYARSSNTKTHAL